MTSYTSFASENDKIKAILSEEIKQLKLKLIELEYHQKQKEIKENFEKTLTVEHHMNNILEFIQVRKDREQNRNTPTHWSTAESERVKRAKNQNAELIPVIESIYSSLDIMNKRLSKLESK